MENLRDLEDELRDYSGYLQDLEFQRDVAHSADAGLLAELDGVRLKIEDIRSRIATVVSQPSEDESLNIQNEIVARYARMHRMNADNAAYWFSKSYAAKFRAFWNQGVRTIPELEYLMYQKGG